MFEVDNWIALLFLILFYVIGMVLFYAVATNLMEDDSTRPACHPYNMKIYFKENKMKLIAILSIIWPVSWFFMWGCCFGNELYTLMVIKNEEDRIAAWLV